MTKKIIDVYTKRYLTDELSGTIDEVIQRLQELKSSQEADTVLVLEFETMSESWSEDTWQQVNIYNRRLETDKEYASRLQREDADKQQRTALMRKQLEYLKKELGEE